MLSPSALLLPAGSNVEQQVLLLVNPQVCDFLIREHVQVKYREATPPNEQLVVRSNVVNIKDNAEQIGGGKPAVQVDITLHQVCFLLPCKTSIAAPCLEHT